MEKPDIEALAREIDRDLHAVRQILRQPLEAEIARGGLTGPQQSAMRLLVNSAGMSVKELSHAMGLAHSTVSGIVDRLEKQGMVERQTDAADRRSSKVVASAEVRQFLRETWPSLSLDPLAAALRAATPAERQSIVLGIDTLKRVLEATRSSSQS